MILLKNFLKKSYMAWRRIPDENVDLILSDLFKIRSRSLMFFLNWNLYFLLHILVVYVESFSNNKVTFHWVMLFSELYVTLWSLKVTESPALFVYACVRTKFLRASISAIYSHYLIYTHANGNESDSSLEWFNFFSTSFFLYTFSYQFFLDH